MKFELSIQFLVYNKSCYHVSYHGLLIGNFHANPTIPIRKMSLRKAKG